MLQCVAVFCNVCQCVSLRQSDHSVRGSWLVAVSIEGAECSALQCVAVGCSVLRCSVLQCQFVVRGCSYQLCDMTPSYVSHDSSICLA